MAPPPRPGGGRSRELGAWLIKRFVDPEAEFPFAAPGDFPPDAVAFDPPGAPFSHAGRACTFETLVARFALSGRRLRHLAELVHDVDLRHGRFGREEAPGLDLAIRGLMATFKDDQPLLAQGLILFDALSAGTAER